MVWALTLLSLVSRARSGETVPPVPGTVAAVVPVDLEALPGRTAAAIYCVICHALPNPTDLDRRTWSEELLPKMRYITGVSAAPTNGYFRDLPRLLAAEYFPKKPLIPPAVFDQIATYYTQAAPERLPSGESLSIEVGLPLFRPEMAPHRHSPPRTPMVRIDAGQRMILASDAASQALDFLDGSGRHLGSLPLGNIAVSLAESGRHWYIGAIGHFFPREEPVGQLIRVNRNTTPLRPEPILSGLPRLAHVAAGDLNGDGRDDLVLCAFGNYLGRLSWLEGRADGGFTERVILAEPGCLRCEIRDFNGDGRPDLMVLQAQARESLLLFLNEGDGKFRRQLIYQRPPSWGHSGFELADFNRDGLPDVLVTNGDNADFNTSPHKAYHGVRIYLNRGGLKWELAWTAPMHGAYRAVARDFDFDGDLDIAAASFFADYETMPQAGFIYFENNSPAGGREWNFKARTLRQAVTGRWISLEAGDLDGDGDDDLVLGSLIDMPTPVPDQLKGLWREKGPSVLILRNQTK
ncbi:MAG: hypothetical protein RIS56_1879 [Verrucomicrobiota bacterium]